IGLDCGLHRLDRDLNGLSLILCARRQNFTDVIRVAGLQSGGVSISTGVPQGSGDVSVERQSVSQKDATKDLIEAIRVYPSDVNLVRYSTQKGAIGDLRRFEVR